MEDKYEATDEQLSERRLTRREWKEANSRNSFEKMLLDEFNALNAVFSSRLHRDQVDNKNRKRVNSGEEKKIDRHF